VYNGFSNTGIFFWQTLLCQKFCVEECIVMMKNPVVMVRSLVFFNERTIIHVPLLENAWLIVLEEHVDNG
jgi:hypothetical protein